MTGVNIVFYFGSNVKFITVRYRRILNISEKQNRLDQITEKKTHSITYYFFFD